MVASVWNLRHSCGHDVPRSFSDRTGEKLFGVRWREGIVVKSNFGGECPACVEKAIAKAEAEMVRLVRKAVAS